MKTKEMDVWVDEDDFANHDASDCTYVLESEKLKAITEDYYKLLVQTQAEILQKDHYKKQVKTLTALLNISDSKIERLEMVLKTQAKEL